MKKQLKDISTREVLKQQHKWFLNNQKSGGMVRTPDPDYDQDMPFTYEVLGKKYGSEKLIFKKM